MHICHECFTKMAEDNYTVSQIKQHTKLLSITSPNVNRFSKFSHWQTQVHYKFINQLAGERISKIGEHFGMLRARVIVSFLTHGVQNVHEAQYMKSAATQCNHPPDHVTQGQAATRLLHHQCRDTCTAIEINPA